MSGRTILDAVMNEPVMCGGFAWSYGFITIALQKAGISDMYLASATNRPIEPSAFDTRKLSWERASELWDALGTGDTETIARIIHSVEREENSARVRIAV
jgi:hypothetical protein